MARQKKPPKRPRTIRVLENDAELTRAGGGAKVLREALKGITKFTTGKSAVGRLNARMLEIVKLDPISKRGDRKIISPNLGKLKGFEFNERIPLSSSFAAAYKLEFDRAAGRLLLTVSAYNVLRKVLYTKWTWLAPLG